LATSGHPPKLAQAFAVRWIFLILFFPGSNGEINGKSSNRKVIEMRGFKEELKATTATANYSQIV